MARFRKSVRIACLTPEITMPLSLKPFDALSLADLEGLVTSSVPEGRTLDYKRDAVGGRDADKKEFLKDVSALANAFGGDLLIGIDEDGGVPVGPIKGVPAADRDAELLRLENLLRDCLEPRLIGVRLRSVPVAPGAHVIAVRVPRSWNPPHRVTYGGWNKFFVRNSNGAHEMNVDELRSSFLQASGLVDRVRVFRAERVASISADQAPALVDRRGRFVVHIVPLTTFSNMTAVDLEAAYQTQMGFLPIGSSTMGGRFTFDGLLVTSGSREAGGVDAYTQVFRNGVLETARGDYRSEGGTNRWAWGNLDRDLFSFLPEACRSLGKIGVGPPYVVMLSLLGFRGTTLQRGIPLRDWVPLDRDDLLLPEVMLEVESFEGAWHSAFRPALDAFWNAYGYSKCPRFDDHGNWKPPRDW